MFTVASQPDVRGHLRVLVGHRPPAPMVRYVDQVVGDEPSDIDFGYFGGVFRNQDADVVHVTDVNATLGGGDKNGAERLAAATALVSALKSSGIALVQTLIGNADRDDAAHRILDSATSKFIILDESTPSPNHQQTTLIPHAHYRERFLGYPRGETVMGRLLCISRSDLNRSAEGPLKVISVTDTPGLTLRVVGDADPTLESLISRSIRRTRGDVSSRVELLSDAEMIREMDAAELVLLPGIESLEDMTILFIALSLDRPVILPFSDAAKLLASEVGSGWMNCYRGPLTAETLDHLVSEARAIERSPRPNLDGRDAETTATQYAEMFRGVAAEVSGH